MEELDLPTISAAGARVREIAKGSEGSSWGSGPQISISNRRHPSQVRATLSVGCVGTAFIYRSGHVTEEHTHADSIHCSLIAACLLRY